MKIREKLLFICFLVASSVSAQLKPALHVDGNQLRDEVGNKVVLNGVADSPSPSRNRLHWGLVAMDDSINACIKYFDKVITALTDKEQGSAVDVFRLHLDPVWTNNPDLESDGTYTGESDISRFSANRLKTYLKKLYWPIISDALKHGLYVVVRPPGVCQGNMNVGGEYQEYLIDVWDVITSNDSIMKYPGQISFEIASEPVVVRDENGVVTDKAMSDFFQPVINIIRENGFEGVIWVPGKLWQQDFRTFVQSPVLDYNMGFAVHDYCGWFEVTDDNCDKQFAIERFKHYVPMVYTNPILITEVDWSPEKEGTGHYDSYGNWVLSNYGTSGTASTSKWAQAFKAVVDNFDNVGVIVSSTYSFIDFDEYLTSGRIGPAFPDVPEACGIPLYQWMAEWTSRYYASTERYCPEQVVPENPFDIDSECFSSCLLYDNTCKKGADDIYNVSLLNSGSVGWRYEHGIDISEYDTLKIEFAEPISRTAYLKIYDTSNFWGRHYSVDVNNNRTEANIYLHSMKSDSGEEIRADSICIIALQTNYVQDIKLKGIRLTKTIPVPEAIDGVEKDANDDGAVYDLNGQRMGKPRKGMYIVGGKKRMY